MASDENKKTPGPVSRLSGEVVSSAVQGNVFVLALRDQVVFPHVRTSIALRRPTAEQLFEHRERYHTSEIGIINVKPGTQRANHVGEIGTYCKIIYPSQSRTPWSDKRDNFSIVVEGMSRFKVVNFKQNELYRIATVERIDQKDDEANDPAEIKVLMSSLKQSLSLHLKENDVRQRGEQDQNTACFSALLGGRQNIRWPHSPSLLADIVGASFPKLTTAERQQVLATIPVQRRLELVLDLVNKVGEAQRISKEINSAIRARAEEEFRQNQLQRRMQEIQKEMRKLKNSKKSSGPNDSASAAPTNGREYLDVQEEEEGEDDVATLKHSLSKAGLSAEAQKIAKREIRRLQSIQPHHPEYIVSRTYLETLASLPWSSSSSGEQDLQLNTAREILDADHCGLEIVKRRILEFLAVQKLRGDMKGPILCLHGPPGVGKTSLGRSIAKALKRPFHRIALGGVRDEAELRGHRRTYVGSMPGVLIQSLIATGVNNPVVLLDEIDKLTKNSMFNPSGALLEILDPEQNHAFKDNYINCAFDISKTLFICTCNDLHTIDRPLLDRMEVIDLSGYTVEEKVAIAERYLLPKQLKAHGLFRKVAQASNVEPELELCVAEDDEQDARRESAKLANVPSLEFENNEDREELDQPLVVLKDSAITDLVLKWTSESGVRSLERKIAEVCRWAALRSVSDLGVRQAEETNNEHEKQKERALAECGPDENGIIAVDVKHLPHIVGVEIFEPNLTERLVVGVAMGLAVTSTGGQLLFVEATRCRGRGRLTVTGQLGEVMRESVMAAMTLLRSKTFCVQRAEVAEDQDPPPPVSPMNDNIPTAAVASGSCHSTGRLPRTLLDLQFTSANPRPPLSKTSSNSQVTQQVRTLFSRLDEKSLFGSDDVHVHFPAGEIPKDGPSAGVTATLALASLLFGRPLRSDTAVTGEITLRGHVLPVGGIKDKVLAAHRAGVRHVLLPHSNRKHAANDLPSSIRKEIELHYVKHIDEALHWMFSDSTDTEVASLRSKL